MNHKHSLSPVVFALILALISSAFFVQPAAAGEGDDAPVDPVALVESGPGDDNPPADDLAPVENETDEGDLADETEPTEGEANASEPIDEPEQVEDAPDESDSADDSGASEEASLQPADEQQPEVEEARELTISESELEFATDELQLSDPILADPIWCPESVSQPVNGGAGCTASYASLADLIDYLSANQPSVAGTIWIEKSYDSSTHDPASSGFSLNGAVLTTMANQPLTIKGAWNGLGTSTIDSGNTSEFNVSLEIVNWNNTVTVSGLLFEGVTAGPALTVTSTKKITLSGVYIVDNNSAGANLNNTINSGNGDVAVLNSQFIDNAGGNGLNILSNGAISLSGVIATMNGGAGAWIDNDSAPSAKPVTINSGVNEFSFNLGNGLVVLSKGQIVLKDIVAVGNGVDGARLDNAAATTAQAVTLSGASEFIDNGEDGLHILSDGAVSLSNIVANGNGVWGAQIDNASAASAMSVKMSGNNEFKANGSGLSVQSRGLIALNNLDASYNLTGRGALLSNLASPTSQGVTITGTNRFSYNYEAGLAIFSRGAVTTSNLTVWVNGIASGRGVEINNSTASASQAVTLNGLNDIRFNFAEGLHILSMGAITVNNLTSIGNGNDGAFLNNTSAPKPMAITFKGAAILSGNDGSGLEAYSNGAITLGATAADDNLGFGAVLFNYFTIAAPIAIKGTSSFSRNGLDGVWAWSKGAISLTNVTASENGDWGAYLDNEDGAATVTITGVNAFNYNGESGVSIFSKRSVTLQSLDAIGNAGYGAYINNDAPGSSGKVTITTTLKNWCNGFIANGIDGLAIYTLGTVALDSLCADLNGGHGVVVENTSAPSPFPVTISKTNSFEENGEDGLRIFSKGAITLSNITATGNGEFGDSGSGNGVLVSNLFGSLSSPPSIKISGYVKAYDNYFNGLAVLSEGAIVITNLDAVGNGLAESLDPATGWGAYITSNKEGAVRTVSFVTSGTSTTRAWQNFTGGIFVDVLGSILVKNLDVQENTGIGARFRNNYPGLASSISLTGKVESILNGSYGLQIDSRGLISLANADVSGNGSYGASLDNSGGTAGVNLTGFSWYDDNGGIGLEIFSKGTVTATNLSAWYNDLDGVRIDTTAGSGAVTIKGNYASFGHNGQRGLFVVSYRAITVTAPIYSSDNGFQGAYLDNSGNLPSAYNITLSGASNEFHRNSRGLEIVSDGVITVKNLVATENDQYGVSLGNLNTEAPRSISVVGTSQFYENGESGLIITSSGVVKLENVTASWNGEHGAYIDNRSNWSIGGVSLSGKNQFDGNVDNGLFIESNGAVTLSNITSRFNEGNGVYIDTISLTTMSVPVTFIGAHVFYLNDLAGLVVMTDSQITLSNVTADWNGSAGTYLNNYTAFGPSPVTAIPGISLGGINLLRFNGGDGLTFSSVGAVTVTNVVADNNAGDGVDGETSSTITISCGSMTNNDLHGWKLNSRNNMTVALKGVFSWLNGSLPGNLLVNGALVLSRIC